MKKSRKGLVEDLDQAHVDKYLIMAAAKDWRWGSTRDWLACEQRQ